MNNYDELIERAKQRYGEKFDASELAPQFIPYFNSEERIKVKDYDEELTGTIGVTTGWKPAFLLMRTSRSLGSSYILKENNQIIAVKRGNKYAKV